MPLFPGESGEKLLDELDGDLAPADFLVVLRAGIEEAVPVAAGVVLDLFDLEGELGVVDVLVVGRKIFDLSSLGLLHQTSEMCPHVNDYNMWGSEGVGEHLNELTGVSRPIAGYGGNVDVTGGEVPGDDQPDLGLAPVSFGKGADGEGSSEVERDETHERSRASLMELENTFNGESRQ